MLGRLAPGLLLLILIAAAPADAVFPGYNGRIAIVSARYDRASEQEEYALHTLAPLKRRMRFLRDCGTEDSPGFCPFGDPAWSPDGERLALSGGSPSRLAVVGSHGGGLTQLPRREGEDDQPAWSPTGDQLVFRRSGAAGAGTDLWIANADGSEPRQLTGGPETDSEPAWSAEGTIAFTREGAVWAVEADGTGLRQLIPGRGRQPDWSPEGDRLAFVRGSKVMVADASGTVLRRVTRRAATRPAWSPDGTRIAFVRGPDVFTIGPRGAKLRRLTKLRAGDLAVDSMGVTAGPDWQPLP